jgi:hypothetical protein
VDPEFLRDSSRSSLLREVAIVLFIAIAPNTFLRESPLTFTVRGSAWLWQTRMYLVRIPRRQGHSIQRVVRPGERLCPRRRIHGHIRVGPDGRDLELHWATRIEQPLPNPDV